MSYLVYNSRNFQIFKSGFATLGAAKRSATAAQKREDAFLRNHSTDWMRQNTNTYCAVDEDEFYTFIDHDVVVKNMMSGKEVTLRASQVGGPCDPSTERYWSM